MFHVGRLMVAALLFAAPLVAQLPESSLKALKWREVGPYRGGRSAAVCGIPQDRDTYYFGSCGGGVWKTQDGGRSWKNVSDGAFGASIGAVAVSEWDPNVIYAGGGEKTVRGNVAHGDGMWRSTDAGRTWKQTGLTDSRHISRIRIHPKNPDLAYAAVMGHLFGPNEQRGVFRTSDGGETWDRVHFVNAHAGCVDLAMDPTNPRILYATFWRILRTPHGLESGGDGSSMWKSTDGGDSWTELTGNDGLPDGTLGIMGITVSPSNPDNVYAIVEAKEGGVFRSRNGGKTWRKTNSERSLRQRAWYYTRIYADTRDEDVVYVLNVGFHKSKDGGKTFGRVSVPHGDNHDLWIDPADPKRMIQSNDGGANVTVDGGATWTPQDTQPTAQMYRLSVDNAFPYRILGGQQDNSALRIRSRSAFGRSITERDWESTAGGESGHVVAKPDDPDIVVGGSYGGYMTMLNHRTGERRSLNPWPDNPMGAGAEGLKYRFQWNYPIFFSPHDPNTLYCAAQVLFKSKNLGHSWEVISPDLTTNDKTRQKSSGGPITKDNTSIEYYCTIFAACESPHEAGVLWCGSDDGLVHVSRNGGKSWDNVTPKWPEWMQVNSIEPHPFEKGGLYVAGTRYKSDDFEPYLYVTTNWGKSWKRIDAGIPRDHFTRVVRADPDRVGLLYAGTERGVHASFDDGETWQPLQQNLPVVPVTDLAVKSQDLVAATQGRGFWVLDDVTPLHTVNGDVAKSPLHLFTPRRGFRLSSGGGGGVTFSYLLDEETAKGGVTMEVWKGDQKIRSYEKRGGGDTASGDGGRRRGGGGGGLAAKPGLNRWTWNLQYEGAESFPGMINWSGSGASPRAIPGTYEARLKAGDDEIKVSFVVRADPRGSATQEDLEAQLAFMIRVRDKLTETHREIKRVRGVRDQITDITKKISDRDDVTNVVDAGKALTKRITGIEEVLYQTKSKSRQDPLNFPIRLNDKLAGVLGVVGRGDFPPTRQAVDVANELTGKINVQLAALQRVWTKDLPEFNKLAKENDVPTVILEKSKKPVQ
ncbi:MAG: glycosyl hydrolase [Planctomycetes bacterium]|nr:glycosyl hydrolase [Planctomycetota bacterium]